MVFPKFKFFEDLRRSNVRAFSTLAYVSFLALGIAGCGDGGSAAPITPIVTPPTASNLAPVVSSLATASLVENSASSFYTLSVSDPDNDAVSTVEVIATGDGTFFTINSQNLQISPVSAIDFELANDADADNIYDIIIRATDSRGASSDFALAVTVEDESDNFSYGLQASLPPSGNFDLLDWKLDLPVSDTGELSGQSAKVDEDQMAMGYTNPEYFSRLQTAAWFYDPPAKVQQRQPIPAIRVPSYAKCSGVVIDLLVRADLTADPIRTIGLFHQRLKLP